MNSTKIAKKSLVISSYDDSSNPYYGGGGASSVEKIASYLAQFYQVTVLSGNYKGAKSRKKNDVFYNHIGPAFLGPKIGQLVFQLLLPWYVLTKKYDVWIESFTPPFSTAFLPFFTQRTVIGFVQMLSGEDMKRKYKLPFPLIERIGLKMYNHFMVLTENSQEKIKKHNKNAAYYITPVGIDTVQKRVKSMGNYILYIGRIEYNQKGLDLLLEAYSLIRYSHSIPLFIAGSGNTKDTIQLQNHITALGLEGHIKVLGHVRGKKKEKLLSEARCIVIPSRFETFNIVALEAMSYARPVIGFGIDGLSWIPAKCMIKVEPFDVQKLCKAVNKVIRDTRYSRMYADNGNEFVEKYTWDNLLPHYAQAVEKAIRENEIKKEKVYGQIS